MKPCDVCGDPFCFSHDREKIRKQKQFSSPEDPISLLQETLEEINGNAALRLRILQCISHHKDLKTNGH